jgi:ParB-like chromosome segregation protein Spo0J
MKIEQWKTSDIVPYENNPRVNDQAVDKVAMSLEQYGWQQPIVVDGDGVVIAGHTRLKAAMMLGMDSCPVVVAADLTPAQVKAYRIADNRTGELAEWDFEKLQVEIDDLKDMEFDIELTGFSLDEFSRIGQEVEDDLLGGNGGEAVGEDKDIKTKIGDIWLCGKHRIMCGSSTDAENVAALLDGAAPGIMVTDPPYGVSYDASWRNDAGLA